MAQPAGSRRRRIFRGGSDINPSWHYWMIYLLPGILIYIFFMAWPLIDSIRVSFYQTNDGIRQFVGFSNYVTLFTDPILKERFWGAFRHTWIFFAIHICVQNVLGMLFATILTNKTMRGVRGYQTILFLPVTLSILVTGYLWKLLLNPVWTGSVFEKMGLGFLSQPYLGMENIALPVISLVSCWQWVGIPTMMFFAALQGISEEVIEAASLEGCSGWQMFRFIQLPLIMPIVGIIAILTFVNNFNVFDVIYAMEGPNGPPNYSTDIIGTFFYRLGIAGEHPVAIPNPGLGATLATVIFIMLTIFVVPTLIKTQREA